MGRAPTAVVKLERPRSLSLYSGDDQKRLTSVSGLETPVLPQGQSATVSSQVPKMEEDRMENVSARVDTAMETVGKRATSAAFGPAVDHRTAQDFSAMSLDAKPEPEESARIVESAKTRNSASHENNRRVRDSFSASHQENSSPERSASSTDGKPSTASGAKSSTPGGMKTTSSGSSGGVKASPSCAQEVGGNQSAHLDLKFYHSPLW